MLASNSETENRSYYQANLVRIAEFKPEVKEQYSDELAVCFMTIRDCKDLLFGVHTNLATGLTKAFVEKVMLIDFNTVVNNLQDYNGTNDTGVHQAGGFMEQAVAKLYLAYGTLLAEDKKNFPENLQLRVNAFLECRTHLRDAYEQLEHLADFVPSPPSPPPLPNATVSPSPEE